MEAEDISPSLPFPSPHENAAIGKKGLATTEQIHLFRANWMVRDRSSSNIENCRISMKLWS